MDLQTLYDDIRDYALNTQGVNSYTIGDPYVIFNSLNMTYPVFNAALNYIQYQDHTAILNMSFYYAGKLKNDSSNLYDLQSEGINALWNVLKKMEDGIEMDGISYVQITPFQQKFADILAGAWCTVDIEIPLDPCENYDKD